MSTKASDWEAKHPDFKQWLQEKGVDLTPTATWPWSSAKRAAPSSNTSTTPTGSTATAAGVAAGLTYEECQAAACLAAVIGRLVGNVCRYFIGLKQPRSFVDLCGRVSHACTRARSGVRGKSPRPHTNALDSHLIQTLGPLPYSEGFGARLTPRPPAHLFPPPRSPDFVINMALSNKGILKQVRPRQNAAHFTVRSSFHRYLARAVGACSGYQRPCVLPHNTPHAAAAAPRMPQPA